MLYLDTERLDGGLYARLGWRALARHEEATRRLRVTERQADVD
jgi:hypothetical protein